MIHRKGTIMHSDDNSNSRTEMLSLLSAAVTSEASDLHLVSDQVPRLRIHGELQTYGNVIKADKLETMLRSIAPAGIMSSICGDAQTAAKQLGTDFKHDLDFSYEAEEIDNTTGGKTLHRFRFNVFYSHGKLGACIRTIPATIPTLEWAGIPSNLVNRLLSFRNGLVLVTGVTGSGKSTTLAILLENMLRQRGSRVVTIEEPIEYVHAFDDNSLITQREVGVDVPSFADGLKYGLRQDPDVIMVGEIRDRETAQMALTAAETGHMVLSTVHTRDAKGAVSRFTDLFPGDRTDEICAQLAINLRSVISQHLLPNATPGQRRVLAMEVMFSNLPVASAIRSNNLVGLGDAIQTGKSDGMINLDDSLIAHLQNGKISENTVLEFANSRTRVQAAIARGPAIVAGV